MQTSSSCRRILRHYLLSGDDIDLIRTRRRAENLLGVAVQICLMRYPGFGWSDGIMPPAELITWLAEQLQVEACTLDDYAIRRNTRHEHHAVAMRHLGLAPFGLEHVQQAEDIATTAAFATDHGVKIVETLVGELRKQHLDRLKYLRSLNLPPNLGHGLHPDRLLKFAREGAVAPVSLLNDFGERRRIATLAAQMADLSITITDATIAWRRFGVWARSGLES